jgi:glycine/D-amino acid oxidase-like deaminating enzyme/nitrite reductase/ring-hydroxylating ferredoxin subunit
MLRRTDGRGRDVDEGIPGRHGSLWTVDVEPVGYAPLETDLSVDVAVVGGGITGLTTALLCADAGLRVAVLEAGTIAGGTTGGTTGKVTSQHDLFYADAIDRLGEPAARGYAEANQSAIGFLAQLAEQHGVDAYASRLPSYVYTRDAAQLPTLRREADAARRLGLPASFVEQVEELGLPFAVVGAMRFDDQLQLHPVRLAQGFARALAGRGASVHERSRVVHVAESDGMVELRTETATVHAGHAIIATLLPINDQGLEFAKTRPVRSYGLAVQLDGELPGAMYLSAGSPKRSLRHYRGDDGDYLVLVGESHGTGHGHDLSGHHRALLAFAREHFPVRSVAYRWSAQDYTPADGVPYVGRLGVSDRVLVATGFKKWGLSNGVVAARIVSDHVQGRANPWAALFDPRRSQPLSAHAELVKGNLEVARRFVGDRIALPPAADPEHLQPGQGRVVRSGVRPIAVCRTLDGEIHTVSAVCTHLGCLVSWNDAETSWDCPCHGSRFDPDGTVLTGPATRPLPPVATPRVR